MAIPPEKLEVGKLYTVYGVAGDYLVKYGVSRLDEGGILQSVIDGRDIPGYDAPLDMMVRTKAKFTTFPAPLAFEAYNKLRWNERSSPEAESVLSQFTRGGRRQTKKRRRRFTSPAS
jgi:hypothetical protein